MKKIIYGILCILVFFAGCSSKETIIEPIPPKKYKKLGKAEGTGSGSLGILLSGYYFIPIGLNTRTENAYEDAVNSVPKATKVINVTYQEDWYWWVIGTSRKVTITGDAIREIK
ncbi:MAG: hypothetical protein DRG78_16780 [Epsilonproteobacteria bacterium]|nr:MAG: hypothetical protein DRG78_16780 [Campylobacterota bacterium]